MKVLLFGSLAEKAGTDLVELQADTTHALKHVLAQHIPGLHDLSFSIAVDRVIVHDDIQLQGNEEIAVLPPFAGG